MGIVVLTTTFNTGQPIVDFSQIDNVKDHGIAFVSRNQAVRFGKRSIGRRLSNSFRALAQNDPSTQMMDVQLIDRHWLDLSLSVRNIGHKLPGAQGTLDATIFGIRIVHELQLIDDASWS